MISGNSGIFGFLGFLLSLTFWHLSVGHILLKVKIFIRHCKIFTKKCVFSRNFLGQLLTEVFSAFLSVVAKLCDTVLINRFP